MTEIRKSALVPYGAGEMYRLVADVQSYPLFLPWCGGSHIVKRETDAITAAVDIAFGGINKSFTTRNQLIEDERIEMQLLDGPFRRLEGHWLFQALGERESKISLHLEFEFANRLLGLAFNAGFTRIADSLVDSFRKRAVQVYGAR